ncbi:MAG: HAMP domain-containing protein [Bacteroidetes bacterium]|nr:HAMP domain-containing protein [Bacteroidota bacterium]
MRNKSLTEKLVLYFLFIGLITIISISWYSFQSGRKAIISRTLDQLTSVRVVKQKLVEKYVADRLNDVQLYAGSNCLNEIGKKLLINPNPDKTQIQQLQQIIRSDKFFTSSIINNENIRSVFIQSEGKFLRIVKTQDSLFLQMTEPDYLTITSTPTYLKQKLYILELRTDKPDQFTLLVTHSSPGIKGVFTLGLECYMDPINTIMIEHDPATGWGNSGETYIVGADHLMKTPSRFIAGSVQKTRVETKAVTTAFDAGIGTIITKDYRKIEVLSSYNKLNIPDLNWVILAEIDLSEAMAPVDALRNEILFLSIFITFMVFLIALFLARSISRPLQKLKRATERIREGDYQIDLKISSDDEIGILTRAFNDMAEQIRLQARARIDGQEAERQRLSRELHDGLGQTLVAARYRLESTDCANSETRRNIEVTKKLVDQIIDEIRRISDDLMPGVLQEFGLEASLQYLVREVNSNSPVTTHLVMQNIPDQLLKIQQVYLFRIVQEGLNNIVKHAGCSESWVSVSCQNEQLKLVIRDNGKGFDPDSPQIHTGKGLHNMRERIHVLHGQMELRTKPEQGTVLTFTIRLNSKANDDKDSDS